MKKKIIKSKTNNKSYTDKNIKVLEGLEAIRTRPGMYIGSIDSRGLHHLVWEIVDNSVDEALAGFATEIYVKITYENTIEISDDGRGIPIEIHSKTKVPTVQTVFTMLHAGGKFGGEDSVYKVAGGLHGVGASVVNALSEWLQVKVYKNEKIYELVFYNGGKVKQKLKAIGKTKKTGTVVHFKPDSKIFETTEFNVELIRQRLKKTTFLNKGLKIILIDEKSDILEEFKYDGGLCDYIVELTKGKEPIHENIIYDEGTINNIQVEFAMQYNDSFSDSVFSFVNSISTVDGGTHEQGFSDALVRIINKYALNKKFLSPKDEKLSREDVREGLIAVISIKHPNPIYEGQTKSKLGNTEVRKIVNKIVSEVLEKTLLENPELGKVIVSKIVAASKARMAARKARDIARKGVLDISSLPGKLADCSSKNPSESEIFIVEGDSAGGSAKLGRNRETQAVLPLRGKVINAEKTRKDRLLSNNEIISLINAFGTGIMEDFDIEKLRYHKIILMTDADVDGSHIRILLLTFIFRYFKALIENGNIYIAQPPLYKIYAGKKIEYVYNEKQKEEIIKKNFKGISYSIQRYKGLGEMNYDQLWETTMDPNKRLLLKVTIDDAIEADTIFSSLMGEEVSSRKMFINENAKFVKNLDI